MLHDNVACKGPLRTDVHLHTPSHSTVYLIMLPQMLHGGLDDHLQQMSIFPANVVRLTRLMGLSTQDMDEFMKVLKGKTRPIAVGGTLISGALMAGLATAYVQAVNDGELDAQSLLLRPSITSPTSRTCQCSAAAVHTPHSVSLPFQNLTKHGHYTFYSASPEMLHCVSCIRGCSRW